MELPSVESSSIRIVTIVQVAKIAKQLAKRNFDGSFVSLVIGKGTRPIFHSRLNRLFYLIRPL